MRVLRLLGATAVLASVSAVYAQGATGGNWPLSGTAHYGSIGFFAARSDGTLDRGSLSPSHLASVPTGGLAVISYRFTIDGTVRSNAGFTASPASCRRIEAELLKNQDSLINAISRGANNKVLPGFLKPTPFPQPIKAYLIKPQSPFATVEMAGTTSSHIKCFYTIDKARNQPSKLTVYATYKR